MGGTRSSHF